jgi:hypothetical protein
MSDLLHAIADAWPKVCEQAKAGDWNLPSLKKVWIDPAGTTAKPVAAGIEQLALAAAESNRGWLRYRSNSFDGERWSVDCEDKGPLLWAEWVDETGKTSHRLAPDGAGCVVCRTYSESEIAKEGWIAVLAEDATLQGHRDGRDLKYRVYWGAPADGDPSAIRRLFARFVGFTKRSNS